MAAGGAERVSRGARPPALEASDGGRRAAADPMAVEAVSGLLERLAPLRAKRRGLSLRWFDEWCAPLEEALAALPEMPACPHDLFRTLMLNPSPTRKRACLVADREGPVAIIGLRRRGPYWQPVTQWTAPGGIAPAREGLLFRALEALGTPVRIPGWHGPLPSSRLVRDVRSAAVYKIDCRADFREHWRRSGQWRFIQKAQRRTQGFDFAVDGEGAAEWTVRGWAERWRDDPARQAVVASDLLLAAEYFQKRGRLHTFTLLDGGAPVAGDLCFLRDDELVSSVIFREPGYDWHGAGTRLTELVTEWAAGRGIAKFDLGAWEPYKAGWAPEDGIEWRFSVCPLPVHLVERAIWKREALIARARGLVAGLTHRGKPVPAGGVRSLEEETQ